MKTRFRKIQILVPASYRMPLLSDLQSLGVLHLEAHESDLPASDSLDEAVHHRNKLQSVIRLLEQVPTTISSTENLKEKSAEEALKQIIGAEQQIEHFDQEIEAAQNEAERLAPWGDFSYSKFEPLLKEGYQVFLCTCTRKVWTGLDLSDKVYLTLGSYGSNVYFAVVSPDEDLQIHVEYFELPKYSRADQLRIAEHKQKERTELLDSISKFKEYLPVIQDKLGGIEDEVFLYSSARSVQWLADGNLVALTGWVPEGVSKKVERFLDQKEITYQSLPPIFGESVPVVLRNNSFTRLFEPITKIFELPNYYETDPTPFIAVFYPILFAYCLGDAGYGAVLLGGAIYGYFSFLKKQRSIALLGIILGLMTTIMGLIKSGSLFGLPLSLDQDVPILAFLGRFVLIPDDSDYIFNAFNVALMIGVVQIISGILISIYNKAYYESNWQALSAVGKLFIVSSLIWIFLSDMQGIEALQGAGMVKYGILIVGILLVMFFHQTELSITRRAASSIMPLFFIFTGILGDILSFVRLFALGLASSVLGLVVNQIGQQIMSGGVTGVIIGILFLAFGHTLNFGIAALGSFVHPLRLTFVEFYGNADFEGKGVVYKPLSKSVNTSHNT
jgi:V/A-type H+-transporting ATPase subunit I